MYVSIAELIAEFARLGWVVHGVGVTAVSNGVLVGAIAGAAVGGVAGGRQAG